MTDQTDAFPTSLSKLRVGRSPIHERGVFAVAASDAGEVLETGPLLVLPEGEPDDDSKLLDYVFDVDGTLSGLLLGVCSLCNHSADPNARVELDTGEETFTVRALRPIAAGDEILIDYGAAYWDDR